MTTYYPVSSEAAGLSLGAALWALVMPAPPAGSVTNRLYAVVEDVNGAWWLEVPDDHATVQLAASLTAEQIEAAVNEIEKMEDANP